MSKISEVESEWCAGNSAYWDAYDAHSNPHDRGTPKSKVWAKGWMAARTEEKQLTGKCSIPFRYTKDDAPAR